jgi:hypothetical protein
MKHPSKNRPLATGFSLCALIALLSPAPGCSDQTGDGAPATGGKQVAASGGANSSSAGTASAGSTAFGGAGGSGGTSTGSGGSLTTGGMPPGTGGGGESGKGGGGVSGNGQGVAGSGDGGSSSKGGSSGAAGSNAAAGGGASGGSAGGGAAGGITNNGGNAGGNGGNNNKGGSSGAAGTSGGGSSGGAGGAPKGLSFVPPEGVTSVALSVNPDGSLLPMRLYNGTAANATITALTVGAGSAFKLDSPPTLPRELGVGQSLDLMVRFAPTTSATATFESTLSATSAAGTPSAGLFGLAMNAQNSEATFAQVVQTLGYKVNVGGTTISLGTGSAVIGDEVAAPRFVKSGAAPVVFQVVARYSPYEAAPYGYYTGTTSNIMRTQLGVMSRGPADNVTNRTLFPALDAGAVASFDPGTEAFGIFAESQSNAASLGTDARFYQEDSLNNDQGSVQPVHRMRVYPLKDRAGIAIPNGYLIGCEEASNSDYQDYVFSISGVSIKN